MVYGLGLAGVAALGIATRQFPGLFPDFVATYGGDALWAVAGFLLIAILLPRARTLALALAAAGLSLAVELSQLYHAPWIDSVRSTLPGALVLGHGFLWSDLTCYAVGVAAAVPIDLALRRATAAGA